MSVTNVFESNAAELERLKQRVEETFRLRSEGPEKEAAWQEAARVLHTSYDQLAFPGGLDRQFTLLRTGDPQAVEMAVQFLEANPWYFRSGYHKEAMIKLLSKNALSNEQCARLRKVIIERVRGRPVREMRGYGRLAAKVSNPEFEAELQTIATNSNRRAVRHARYILQYLKSATPHRLS